MNTGERLIGACIAALIGVALLAAWTDVTEFRRISTANPQAEVVSAAVLEPPADANL